MGKLAPKISADAEQELKKLLKDDKLEEAEEQAAQIMGEEGAPVATSGAAARTPANLLALQRTVGNKAVQRLIKDAVQRNASGGEAAAAPKADAPKADAPKAAAKENFVALPDATYKITEEDGKLVAKMRDGKDDSWLDLELQEDSNLWKDKAGALYKLGDGSNTIGEGNKVLRLKD